jgi:hypothetical protein
MLTIEKAVRGFRFAVIIAGQTAWRFILIEYQATNRFECLPYATARKESSS